MALKISASSRFHTVYPGGRFSPFEMLEHFHKVGFEAVDFDLETVPDMGEEWRTQVEAIANLAAKQGIELYMGHLPFHYPLTPEGEKDEAQFACNMLQSIEAAGMMGIRHAVIHPIGKHEDKAEYDMERTLAKCIAWATPFAEHAVKHGVTLAFENMRSPKENEGKHRFSSYADELAQLADHFGMECCWDFGHAHTSGVPQGDSIRLLGRRLTTLHVNDNHGGEDEHLLPYFGTINWNDALSGLRDIGFAGTFNYECKVLRQPPEIREELCRFAVALAGRMSDFSKLK